MICSDVGRFARNCAISVAAGVLRSIAIFSFFLLLQKSMSHANNLVCIIHQEHIKEVAILQNQVSQIHKSIAGLLYEPRVC
jgi:hypothetical protein